MDRSNLSDKAVLVSRCVFPSLGRTFRSLAYSTYVLPAPSSSERIAKNHQASKSCTHNKKKVQLETKPGKPSTSWRLSSLVWPPGVRSARCGGGTVLRGTSHSSYACH
jgi:hypothetical protein